MMKLEPHADTRRRAAVLLGPTGSGKSPLGEALERNGLRGRCCAHFDFGRHLRQAGTDAAHARACGLSAEEQAVVADVLQRGALLEDTWFSVALKLLDAFMEVRTPDGAAGLIMNGLPRHGGQARLLEDRLRVDEVILLDCSAETVLQRIRMNTGGDRTGRSDDDDAAAVRLRIRLFHERTAPLEAYYAGHGARITRLAIRTDTTASDLARALNREEAGIDAR